MLEKKDVENIILELSKISDNINVYNAVLKQPNADMFIDFVLGDRNFIAFFIAFMRTTGKGNGEVQNKDVATLIKNTDQDMLEAIVVLYCVLLKLPKNRSIVTLSTIKLVEVSAKLLLEWKKILIFLGRYNEQNLQLVCYAFLLICILEHVFEKDSVRLLEIFAVCDTNFCEVLKNLYDINIFEVVFKIAGFDWQKHREVAQNLQLLFVFHFGKIEYAHSNINKTISFLSKPTLQEVATFKRALQ